MCSVCVGVMRGKLCWIVSVFCVQGEDGIRDLVRSRGLGDVYKRQFVVRVIPTDILWVSDPRLNQWRGSFRPSVLDQLLECDLL